MKHANFRKKVYYPQEGDLFLLLQEHIKHAYYSKEVYYPLKRGICSYCSRSHNLQVHRCHTVFRNSHCRNKYFIFFHIYLSDLFEWTNLDLVDYVNWMSEPSMHQSCVDMKTDTTGEWREHHCQDDTNNYACKMMQCKIWF